MERVLIEMKVGYLTLPVFPTERNRVKAVFDVLEGTLFENDSQIDQLSVIRKPMEKGKGRCRVTISEIKEPLRS